MSLSLYKKKRSFEATPEPAAVKKSSKDGGLRFVIQKHDASRLHYDFRLEMEGVLKSWAVPKGPSLNPADKRLAMMVEDHPFDYRSFEGIIPEGNYGAGTVIVWDEGTYEILDAEDQPRSMQEKLALKMLKDGDLKVVMHGKKIKGAFALVKMKRNEDNSWLLIKKADDYATSDDITEKEKSVISGKTLSQVEKSSGSRIYGQKEPKESEKIKKAAAKKNLPTKKPAAKKAAASKKKIQEVNGILKKYKDRITKSPLPVHFKPMLATLVDSPFDDKEWIYEIKWDGYRAIGTINNGNADIRSRNDLSFAERYSPVVDALEKWNVNALVDGEIVAVDEKGYAQFQGLQNWQRHGEGALLYYIFDIMWLDGYDLTGLTLLQRKEILREILPEDDVLKYSDHIQENGTRFYEEASVQGLEGIIAKKADSVYSPDARSRDWVKIKTTKRQEVVIGGYTAARNSRSYFGALILGVYNDDGELEYAGHTGSGFNHKTLEDTWRKLQPLVNEKCPFVKKPRTNMPATWVKPNLLCEVKFQEWTNDGLMRQAIFLGLRTDKKAKEVKRESEMTTKTIQKKSSKQKLLSDTKKVDVKKSTAKKSILKTPAVQPIKAKSKTESTRKSTGKIDSKILLPEGEKDVVLNIDGKDLKFTNLDKIYWKKEKYTKRDMLNYYHRISPYMLPYMQNRPQSLNRHPNGVGGMSFYQKDVEGKVPDWAVTHGDFSEANNAVIQYYVCHDEAHLLYLANLGCIEMNPWHSKAESPDHPDYCLIDLDPYQIGFNKVIETALALKQILDELKIPGYPKTSGATGLHIYIPLGAKYNYDQSKQLAELIVTMLHHDIPAFTSIERSPAKRKRKVYLDYLQNRQAQTVAAPYSLRPKDGATVSTPLHWDEVKPGLSPEKFTIKNIFDRLKTEGDLFKPVLQRGIDMERVLRKIEAELHKL